MKNLFNIKSIDKIKITKNIIIKAIFIYIMVLILGGLSIFIFVRGLNLKDEYKYVYRDKDSINYKVYLKDNEFYNTNYLDKGNVFIANLIDKIDINFNHNIDSDDYVCGYINYYVKLRVEAFNKNTNDVIWSSDDKLISDTNYNFRYKRDFGISPSVSIDYDKYKNIVSKFKDTYGVDVDSRIIVSLYSNNVISHKLSNKDIKDSTVSSISIPIKDGAVNVKLDYKDIDTKSNTITYYTNNGRYYLFIVLGVILFIVYLYMSCCILSLFFEIYDNRNKYSIYVRKILNKYKDDIILVDKLPSTKGKTLLDLSNFNDLLDVYNKYGELILYSEISKRDSSIFMIIVDSKVYRYKVKYIDFCSKR